MTDELALFDMTPLTPAEVIRRRGYHPITLLGIDPDETHTCGNCANRRWIFDDTGGDWHDTVCAAVTRCEFSEYGMVAHGQPLPDLYCEEPCCSALAGDEPWSRAWPWAEKIEPWMPACAQWRDLMAEQIMLTLAGAR